MPQRQSSEKPAPAPTVEDVKKLFGDLDDQTIVEVLALQPAMVDLEEAARWVYGDRDTLPERHQLSGMAAQIVDLVEIDEEDPLLTRGAGPRG